MRSKQEELVEERRTNKKYLWPEVKNPPDELQKPLIRRNPKGRCQILIGDINIAPIIPEQQCYYFEVVVLAGGVQGRAVLVLELERGKAGIFRLREGIEMKK